ncbi:MAG: family clan aspartic protease [Caulobacter sp.]|nr:family clan aspartic protease [Caulobacter sp.]
MLRIAVIAIVATVSAVGAAKTVVALDTASREPRVVAAQATTSVVAPPADAAIVKAADGHYWAEATVNGKAVRFLVDTGATTVALTREDALRLGFNPQPADYTYTVTTADGQTRAAPAKLSVVSVAGARVENVDALIIEKGLTTSLLGMTYLGRLSKFEATQTSLILRP